jgi:hypothetical protein
MGINSSRTKEEISNNPFNIPNNIMSKIGKIKPYDLDVYDWPTSGSFPTTGIKIWEDSYLSSGVERNVFMSFDSFTNKLTVLKKFIKGSEFEEEFLSKDILMAKFCQELANEYN